MTVEEVKTALRKKNSTDLQKNVPVSGTDNFVRMSLPSSLVSFVFALIFGILCGLAQQLIQCMVFINLALESLQVGTALHPFAFVQMQSPDDGQHPLKNRHKNVDSVKLAKVTKVKLHL